MEGFLKYFARFGIPGLALFVLLWLFNKFDFKLTSLSGEQIFQLTLAFMAFVATVILSALVLYRDSSAAKSGVSEGNGSVSMRIPKDCTFEAAAKAIAGDKLISFEGFSPAELSTPLKQQAVSATSVEFLIGKLREVATQEIRAFVVNTDASGTFVARIIV